MDASENVFAFPNAAERKATTAMTAYEAGLADIVNGRQKAIRAVIDYGAALLEGRNEHPDNKAFAEWVATNKLDQGKPWDARRERTSAMQIAEIVRESSLPDAFAGCPNTRPNDIIGWYRRQHPELFKPQAPRPSKDEATQKALGTIEEMAAAGEELIESRIVERAGVGAGTVNKALNLYRKTKEAAEKATIETTAKLTEDQALARANFSPKSKMTIAKAIQLHKKRLEKQFWSAVDQEVRKRIAEADDYVRKSNAEMQKTITSLERMLRGGALFTEVEFTTILACLHPDNSASEAKRARAFDLFRQKKPRMIRD